MISTLGRELLRRPFPEGSCCRVLLIYQDDKLAYPQFAPFLREAHRFEALGVHFRAVRYPDYDPHLLSRDLDAIFLQSTYEPGAGELERLLGGVKATHPTHQHRLFRLVRADGPAFR